MLAGLIEIASDNLFEKDRIKESLVLSSGNTKEFYKALDRSFVFGNKGISVPFWSKKLDKSHFYELTKVMIKTLKLVEIEQTGNYATIKLIPSTLEKAGINLFDYKSNVKISHYLLNTDPDKIDKRYNLTSTNNKIKYIGLKREGFLNCVYTRFTFDNNQIKKYLNYILENNSKSLQKILEKYPEVEYDKTNFNEATKAILYEYIRKHQWYNLQGMISDSRGRAISHGKNSILNPITSKEGRSLLNFKQASNLSIRDKFAIDRIYLFIAELNSIKAKTWDDKLQKGKELYKNKVLPEIKRDYDKDGKKSGWKEVEERVWCERIYAKLDQLIENGEVYWDIPIEMDATASMIQIMGAILNNFELLNSTNVIEPNDLQDFWGVPEECKYLTRKGLKAVFTPRLYGSKGSIEDLLEADNIQATKEVVTDVEMVEKDERFKVPMMLRDFIIQLSSIKNVYLKQYKGFVTDVGEERFFVEVNKFKTVGIEPTIYKFYDPTKRKTQTGKIKIKEKIEVPDFDRFKTYLFTLLIHNLDSQIANYVCEQNTNIISIDDAFLVLPQDAEKVLNSYKNALQDIRDNGWQIFREFCLSIGFKEALLDWDFDNPDPELYEEYKNNYEAKIRVDALKQIKMAMNTAEGYEIVDSCLK